MILAIDVGNTNIVLGCIESGEVKSTVRMRTDSSATWAEYAIKMSDFLNLLRLDICSIEGTVISSVVPPVTDALVPAVEKLTGRTPLVVRPDMDIGMEIALDDPTAIAGDLICGGVGAIAGYGAPCIVIDLGTATTITAVDAESRFLGGAIIPGVRLGLNALTSGTSLLPEISLSAPEKAISTNTADCMRSGIVLGCAAMLDGMIDRFFDELGAECTIVATGGLAPSVVRYCRHKIICDDNLLLKGLWEIYKRNGS